MIKGKGILLGALISHIGTQGFNGKGIPNRP